MSCPTHLEQTKSAVLSTLTSKRGQRTYDHAINEFVDWYCSEPRLAFNRTWPRLSHLAGGELDQTQVLLGHVSIKTNEHYLGCKQKLRFALNDNFGIEP